MQVVKIIKGYGYVYKMTRYRSRRGRVRTVYKFVRPALFSNDGGRREWS